MTEFCDCKKRMYLLENSDIKNKGILSAMNCGNVNVSNPAIYNPVKNCLFIICNIT